MVKPGLILFIDWFTPAYKAGGPISSIRNLCQALSSNFDIYVVTGDRDLGDSEPFKTIKTNSWIKKEDINVMYVSLDQQNHRFYSSIIDTIKPEVVHLNSLFSKNFTLLPLKILKKSSIRTVVSPRGMFGEESLKIKPIKKKLFFIYARITGLFKNVIWHATSASEVSEIKNVMGNSAEVIIASNFSFLPPIRENYLEKKDNELNLISVGRISRIKNIDFLLRVLKLSGGKITCRIVGPIEDESYYNECLSVAETLPKFVSVEFIDGMDHHSLAELYQKSHLFISPTKNENFGHSITEAWGFGCPVIISDKTPWKNLKDSQLGFDLPLKETLFTEALEKFTQMNSDDFHKMRTIARKKAEDLYSANTNLDDYKKLYGR